jgi:fatty acid desaturase
MLLSSSMMSSLRDPLVAVPPKGCDQAVLDKRALAGPVGALARIDAVRGIAWIAVDWAVIVVTAMLAWHHLNPWLWPLPWLVIAARQHALGVLMHEAAHHMLIGKGRANDLVADLLCAYPLFVTTRTYRRNHLKHHAHLNSDLDPDWVVRVSPPSVRQDWEFPKTRWQLTRLFLREALGGGFLYLLTKIRRFGGSGVSPGPGEAGQPSTLARRVAYYSIAAGLITVLGLWTQVVLWWLAPAVTFLPVLLRVRGIAEHFALPGQHELNNARNVFAPFWERWLLAPHNICQHLDHHLFPYVPFYRLPALHRALESDPIYRRLAHENSAYLFGGMPSVLSDLVSAGKD